MSSEKLVGICVRTDRHMKGGYDYSIIWNRHHGQLAVKKRYERGTWVLFIPTKETLFIECKYRPLLHEKDIEVIPPTRLTERIKDTIQVLAQVDSIDYRFNEHFLVSTDVLLGKVLVPNRLGTELRKNKQLDVVAAYFDSGMFCAQGHNWTAVKVQQGTATKSTYEIIKGIPRLLLIFAEMATEPVVAETATDEPVSQ